MAPRDNMTLDMAGGGRCARVEPRRDIIGDVVSESS